MGSALIAPLATHLIDTYGLRVLGGCRVETVVMDEETGQAVGLKYLEFSGKTKKPKTVELADYDAVVLALGAKGMRGVVGGSPALAKMAPELTKAASLGGIDVVTTRIWLDR